MCGDADSAGGSRADAGRRVWLGQLDQPRVREAFAVDDRQHIEPDISPVGRLEANVDAGFVDDDCDDPRPAGLDHDTGTAANGRAD